MNRLMAGLLTLLVGTLLGCSRDDSPKTVPAEGIVTLDGAPVEGAAVIFVANQGSNNASGVTDKEGKFKANAFDHKTGAVPGSYKVIINKTNAKPASDNAGETNVTLSYGVPQKYSVITTSGLTLELGTEGNKVIQFDLKSK